MHLINRKFKVSEVISYLHAQIHKAKKGRHAVSSICMMELHLEKKNCLEKTKTYLEAY